MIMEAGNLPSTICKLNTEASWLNWTLTGIIESKSKGLRTRSPLGKSLRLQCLENQELWYLGAGKDASQHKKRGNLPFLLFVVLGPPKDWWGWFSSLSLPHQMLLCSRNALTDTPRNNVLAVIWAPVRSAKLIQKVNHHNNCLLIGGEFYLARLPCCCCCCCCWAANSL